MICFWVKFSDVSELSLQFYLNINKIKKNLDNLKMSTKSIKTLEYFEMLSLPG